MKFLLNIKYLIITSLLFVVFTTSAFAASSPVATRSNEIKTKACQAREQVIKTRTNNLQKMTENMMKVFDKITLRVTEYYSNKVVANGKTISNYDALIQAVQSKKNEAQAALNKANQDSAGFSCQMANPKGSLVQYRKDMQLTKSALKEYRTSIKNLIVAVKSVSGTSGSEKLSVTPRLEKQKSK